MGRESLKNCTMTINNEEYKYIQYTKLNKDEVVKALGVNFKGHSVFLDTSKQYTIEVYTPNGISEVNPSDYILFNNQGKKAVAVVSASDFNDFYSEKS